MTGPVPSLAALVAALATLGGGAGQVGADSPAVAPPALAPASAGVSPTAEDIAAWEDVAKRMSVPVRVNGQGPFRFILDTGADHSVVSRELATTLGLTGARARLVHSVLGSEMTPSAEVASLEVGSRRLTQLELATLPQANLGGEGILGLDALADQRVVLDFDRQVMRVERSRGMGPYDPDAVVVRAKRRFGRLVLVESSLVGKPIYVILDSGAQSTIANAALRRILAVRRNTQPPSDQKVNILSVTGAVGEGERDELPELVLGGVAMRHVPVIYSELHAFRKFDLAGEPAMLLGVDVMRAFRQVDVDFGRREVRFGFRGRPPGAGPGIRLSSGTNSRIQN